MKTILLSIAFLFAMAANAQTDNWIVKHNNKIVLQTNKEDMQANKVIVLQSSLKKTGKLEVVFNAANALEHEWVRKIIITTEDGAEVFQQDMTGKTFSLTNKELKNYLKAGKPLQVYTWAVPADPAKAALVRVRRVHLVTLGSK